MEKWTDVIHDVSHCYGCVYMIQTLHYSVPAPLPPILSKFGNFFRRFYNIEYFDILKSLDTIFRYSLDIEYRTIFDKIAVL